MAAFLASTVLRSSVREKAEYLSRTSEMKRERSSDGPEGFYVG